MNNNYIMRGALALGIVAMVGTSALAEETKGGWRNINNKVENISRVSGWSGVITGATEGVAEIYYSAGLAYQVIPDAPAGVYKLSAQAFYRCADGNAAYEAFKAGNHPENAHIFIGETTQSIPCVYDEEYSAADIEAIKAHLLEVDPEGGVMWQAWEDERWGFAPNGLNAVSAAFAQGKYAVSMEANHAGGDLVIGIRNLGNLETVNAFEEWMTFGNFKLEGPAGEVELINPEMVYGGDAGWNLTSAEGKEKARGNHNGGVFSKTNASIYNFGYTLNDMPAGKYRFVCNAFNCHFLGQESGYYLPMKGELKVWEGKSARDLWEENAAEYPIGQVNHENGTVGFMPVEVLEAYVYMNEGEKEVGFLDADTNFLNPWEELVENGKQVKVKNIFEEDLEVYPHSNNYFNADGSWRYMTYDGEGNLVPMWWESGSEREAAACFVNHPELYLNVVEMEFTKESNTFTFGLRKDFNQNNYWQPSFDYRLEYWDPEYAFGETAVNTIASDNAAPVYYNLQGVRVANPSEGIFIVKKGNKTYKQIFK